MSQYSVNTVRINLRARAAAVAAGLLDANRGCIDSLSLGLVDAPLRCTTSREGLEARWRALDALSGTAFLLDSVCAVTYSSALQLTEESRAAERMGNMEDAEGCAKAADLALRQAVSRTVTTLRVDERRLAASLATNALTKLGYEVQAASGNRSVGLWATRDHHVMAILVQDGGAMEIDNAGVLGGGCVAPMEDLQRTLAEMGADAQVVRRISHGDDHGGHLIARACQANEYSPATGLVDQFEVGVRSTETPAITRATRLSQTLGEPS